MQKIIMEKDIKILSTIDKLNNKLSELKKKGNDKFNPITNCKFICCKDEINIHILSQQQCMYYIGLLTAIDNNIITTLKTDKGLYEDVIVDLIAKYNSFLYKDTVKQLEGAKKRLESSLSEDTQTIRFIESISHLID